MKAEKKSALIRVLIFIAVTFVPSLALQFWGGSKDGMMNKAVLGVTIMLMPLMGNLATRLITKESMAESYLKLNAKGNMKYYVIAVAMPVMMAVLGGISIAAAWAEDYSLSANIEEAGGALAVTTNLLVSFWAIAPMLTQGLGEELGWRGYLTPKLTKLMPEPIAILLTGIIWGLWHGPLVYNGYNFGQDHRGWTNVMMMCLACIGMAYMLTFLTKMTGSVWPAALCHTVLDATLSSIALPICGYSVYGEHRFGASIVTMIAVPCAAALVCCILMYMPRAKREPGN